MRLRRRRKINFCLHNWSRRAAAVSTEIHMERTRRNSLFRSRRFNWYKCLRSCFRWRGYWLACFILKRRFFVRRVFVPTLQLCNRWIKTAAGVCVCALRVCVLSLRQCMSQARCNYIDVSRRENIKPPTVVFLLFFLIITFLLIREKPTLCAQLEFQLRCLYV